MNHLFFFVCLDLHATPCSSRTHVTPCFHNPAIVFSTEKVQGFLLIKHFSQKWREVTTERLMLVDPLTCRISTTRNQRLQCPTEQCVITTSGTAVMIVLYTEIRFWYTIILLSRTGAKESDSPLYKSAQNITRMFSPGFAVIKVHGI